MLVRLSHSHMLAQVNDVLNNNPSKLQEVFTALCVDKNTVAINESDNQLSILSLKSIESVVSESGYELTNLGGHDQWFWQKKESLGEVSKNAFDHKIDAAKDFFLNNQHLFKNKENTCNELGVKQLISLVSKQENLDKKSPELNRLLSLIGFDFSDEGNLGQLENLQLHWEKLDTPFSRIQSLANLAAICMDNMLKATDSENQIFCYCQAISSVTNYICDAELGNLQELLGVTSGDVAGVYFSLYLDGGEVNKDWSEVSPDQRFQIMRDYIGVELNELM